MKTSNSGGQLCFIPLLLFYNKVANYATRSAWSNHPDEGLRELALCLMEHPLVAEHGEVDVAELELLAVSLDVVISSVGADVDEE